MLPTSSPRSKDAGPGAVVYSLPFSSQRADRPGANVYTSLPGLPPLAVALGAASFPLIRLTKRSIKWSIKQCIGTITSVKRNLVHTCTDALNKFYVVDNKWPIECIETCYMGTLTPSISDRRAAYHAESRIVVEEILLCRFRRRAISDNCRFGDPCRNCG